MTHEDFHARLIVLIEEARDTHEHKDCGSGLCDHFLVHDLIIEIARLAKEQEDDIKFSVVECMIKHLFHDRVISGSLVTLTESSKEGGTPSE